MGGTKMECNEQIEFDYMDNEKYIYKSNNLVESSYSLSLNAQRLIYMGAKKLKPIFIKSNIKPSQLKSFLATKTFGDLKISNFLKTNEGNNFYLSYKILNNGETSYSFRNHKIYF